jgi:pimeloyl-ACP methyl ester carboxylesterase
LGTFDVRRRLKEIDLPTLVISAEQDTTVPLDNQADLVRGIKGAKQVMIPSSRHAVIVDQPELFNQALIQFLKQP